MIINELWNKSPERRQETPKEFTRLQVNDRVVTEGLPGIVRSVGRGGYFVVVENDRGIRSFRADQVQLAEHGGGIGPKQHWQDLAQEDTVSEFAPQRTSNGQNGGPPSKPSDRWDDDDGDNDVSRIVLQVADLLKSGNKVDSRILGSMGHVVDVEAEKTEWGNGGLRMKPLNRPYSRRMLYRPFLKRDDHKYALEMKGPGHWVIVDANKNNQLEDTVNTMAHDELEDDTDLDESERIDERAGPVSVIRWGKPWLDAGRDGERVTSTPGYTIDYTQDNPDFQADAHESELETFFKEFTPLGLDAVYVVEPTEDEQGTPHGTANCDLVNYTTAKPTLKNIMPDDPEAPQLSNMNTDAEMFNGREESSSDPYDLDYPKKSSSTLDLANQIAEAVARINPSLILDHTDSEITEVCYQIADSYWGKRTISESDRGIMAHRAIRILRS